MSLTESSDSEGYREVVSRNHRKRGQRVSDLPAHGAEQAKRHRVLRAGAVSPPELTSSNYFSTLENVDSSSPDIDEEPTGEPTATTTTARKRTRKRGSSTDSDRDLPPAIKRAQTDPVPQGRPNAPQPLNARTASMPVQRDVLESSERGDPTRVRSPNEEARMAELISQETCPLCLTQLRHNKSKRKVQDLKQPHRTQFANHINSCGNDRDKQAKALQHIGVYRCVGTRETQCTKLGLEANHRCTKCLDVFLNTNPGADPESPDPHPSNAALNPWNPPEDYPYDPVKEGIKLDDNTVIDAAFLTTRFRPTVSSIPDSMKTRLNIEYDRLICAINRGVPGAFLYRDLMWIAVLAPRPFGCTTSLKQLYLNRWTAWKANKYHDLLSFTDALTPRQRTSDAPKRTVQELVEMMVASGQQSKAARIITSDGIAPADSAEAYAQVVSKFPQSDLNFEAYPDPPNGAYQIVKTDTLKDTINKLRSGSAPGIGCFRPEHLKDLVNHGTPVVFLANYCEYINRILRDDLSPSERKYLLYTEVVALYKDSSKKDVRPIAISSVHRRIASMSALHAVKDKVTTIFDKLYFAGRKGGADIMTHSARCLAEQFSTQQDLNLFLSLDAGNAFGMADRETILNGFHQNLPELFPYVRLCYTNPSTMVFGPRSFHCTTGVLQGDPLSTLAFNFIVKAIRETIAPIAGKATILSYVDDILICGPADNVLQVYNKIKADGNKLGYVLQPKKCRVSQPNQRLEVPNSLRVFSDDNLKGISLSQGKLSIDFQPEILGVPITLRKQDASTQRQRAYAIISGITAKLDKIDWSKLNGQCAFSLLRMCLSYPAINYHLRLIPPNLWHGALQTFDKTMRHQFLKICRFDSPTCKAKLDDFDWIRFHLPIRLTGLGFRSAQQHSAAAFLASLSQYQGAVDEVLDDNESAKRELNKLFQETSVIWKQQAKAESLPEKTIQKVLSSAIDKRTYEQALDNLGTDIARREGFKSCNGSGLHLLPGEAGTRKLTTDEFRGAIAAYLQLHRRMIQPKDKEIHCKRAREKSTTTGAHTAAGCSTCCETTDRHDDLAMQIAAMMRECKKHGGAEARPTDHALIDRQGRRWLPGDIHIKRVNDTARDHYLDVKVIDPLCKSHNAARVSLTKCFENAIQDKRNKYRHITEPRKDELDFDPIVFSAYGRLAPPSTAILTTLSNKQVLARRMRAFSLTILWKTGEALYNYYQF